MDRMTEAQPTLPPVTPSSPPSAPLALAAHSRFVQRIRRRYAAELALLPPGRPDRAGSEALILRLQGGGRPLASALRVLALCEFFPSALTSF